MGGKRGVILVEKSRVWEGQRGSRKGVDEAGGGCPPERVAGRSLLQVRVLISLLALPGIRTQGESECGLLMTGNRERRLRSTCLPALSFPLRICSACLPPRWGIQREFDHKSLDFEFITQAGPLASGL